ncbi:hypothetical protein POX_h09460 [Penicillium oxalicum]|uniref:Uncharacterized protein n=1 Tax=Penicillium oxalicum (strain 114-2 / CGMCC 5302) TaxID=933388 RepID=S7ZR73_PENO1|nr:hypothetical protein POX_h09460 [Penicillium oxalicum]EPS31161.1 hypothetical protein PDE_06116 [Penicillium oxalicum 114-2]KAI2785702.1 hypothetical protein POX_h09460 [Penicillium oxalicum]
MCDLYDKHTYHPGTTIPNGSCEQHISHSKEQYKKKQEVGNK